MFGLSYFRLAAYAVALIAIIGVIATVNGWRKDSNKLSATEDQLELVTADLSAERKCTVGTECAARIKRNADEAAKAVADAQKKAKDESEAQQKANEEKTRTEIQKQSKSLADHYQNLFKIQSVHSQSCDEWEKSPNPCNMELK